MIEVRLARAGRVDRRQVEDDAQLRAAARRAQRLQRQAVTEQQVVRHLGCGGAALLARREDAPLVAHRRDDPGLVVGGDRGEPIAQPRVHAERVVDEAAHGVALGPAAALLQGLGQVPVVQRQVGLDAARQQAIHQALVEAEAARVPGAVPLGLHTRPRHREAVGIDAERGDQVEVVLQAVVVVAGDSAVAAVGDGARLAAEAVPDRRPLAVGLGRAFDLERAGGHTPDEVVGKAAVRIDGQDGRVHLEGAHYESAFKL